MKKDAKKLFITRKYIWAKNAQQAIKLERKTPCDECWLDEDWKKNNQMPKDAIGFQHDE